MCFKTSKFLRICLTFVLVLACVDKISTTTNHDISWINWTTSEVQQANQPSEKQEELVASAGKLQCANANRLIAYLMIAVINLAIVIILLMFVIAMLLKNPINVNKNKETSYDLITFKI